MFGINSFVSPPKLSIGSLDPFDIGITDTLDVGSVFNPKSGSGGLLGGLLGSFTPIAGGFLSDIIGGLLNGGSKPAEFYQHAKRFFEQIVPQIKQRYSNSLTSLFTELDKGVGFMIAFYDDHFSASSSDRSKKGNGQGLEDVTAFRKSIRDKANELKKHGKVSYSTVKQKFPNAFYTGMTSSGDLEGEYREYRISVDTSKLEDSNVSADEFTKPREGGSNKGKIKFKWTVTHTVIAVVAAVPLLIYAVVKLIKRKR